MQEISISEVGLLSAGLCGFLRGLFVDCTGSSILILLWEGRLWLWLLLLILFWKSDRRAPGRTFDLDVLLYPKEDVLHLVDFMFHQVLVEEVGDFQHIDKCCCSYIFIAIICQGHLTLKVIDIVFDALIGLHLDREEVIVVLLKLKTRGKLVVEGLPHLFEVSE